MTPQVPRWDETGSFSSLLLRFSREHRGLQQWGSGRIRTERVSTGERKGKLGELQRIRSRRHSRLVAPTPETRVFLDAHSNDRRDHLRHAMAVRCSTGRFSKVYLPRSCGCFVSQPLWCEFCKKLSASMLPTLRVPEFCPLQGLDAQ